MNLCVFTLTNMCMLCVSTSPPLITSSSHISLFLAQTSSVRSVASTFLTVHTCHCIQFHMESVMQKHYRTQIFIFCYTTSNSICSTRSYLTDSPARFYLSEHLLWPSLSRTNASGPRTKKTPLSWEKHFWTIDPEIKEQNHIQWKKKSVRWTSAAVENV